ncbi:MAG: hypothetical protein KDD47_26100 [Acidobacteria bacterium]|nr:hypothetical protein [Acidobacteriota bacterium]
MLAASAPPARAMKTQDPEDRPLEPKGRHRLATVTALGSEGLEVQVDDSLETLEVVPRHFGGWRHAIGDRVFVVEEPGDPAAAEPLVTPIDAPLPVSVEMGRMIWLGETSARVTSPEVVERAKEIRFEGTSGPCHWLLIENTQAGECRVFGVINRHGSSHPH